MDKVEILKESLENIRRNNEETKKNVEGALFSEKVYDLSNKEEALTILIECAYCIKVIARLCNLAINEAGKSLLNGSAILIYTNELEYYNKELDSLIDKYNLIRKKRAEEIKA